MRGLAVVNKQVIWVSGTKGTIGKSVDGGKTWKWMQPKGYEKLDFRDIQAFDQHKAIVVNAGSPAYILSTVDGGKTWRENYKNTDSAAFFNGMDFWDAQNGIVFGDPIHHQMQLLRTDDGGLSWKNISEKLKQPMKVGEAGFAASGTSIKTAGNGKVWIATGGVVSNIYYSANYGQSWKVFKCPIIQGENSTGVFSIDFFDEKNGVAVGGNYLNDKDNQNNVLLTSNGGKKWKKPIQPVSGYRSGVTFVTKDFLIATGTSGTDISRDGGKRWQNISGLSCNAVKASDGLVILVDGKGQIYRLDTVL
ncbi:oxidoreductase [Pedobacter chitinilyticus]|uniref:Oxidoreductase n=2 Tax=Pedobacter chitinilyticus TaxID=2233776 RepID=A0A443YXI4_9SPHI|nr:oxidoreductase [Pedobacter chitinilyticus]